MLGNGTTHTLAWSGRFTAQRFSPSDLARSLVCCKGQNSGFTTLVALIATLLFSTSSLDAQDLVEAETSNPEAVQRMDLEKLPEPPASIAALVQRAAVTMSAGPRRARARPNPSMRGGTLQIAAETEFKMRFHYRSQQRWRVRRGKNGHGLPTRVLIIRVRMRKLYFETKHHIWFLDRPSQEGFWETPLVLHELDHVLISSDPSLKKLFESKVGELREIEYLLAAGETPSEALVKGIVDTRIEAAFEQVSDLASIRYRELDQVTRHGQDPLPTGYRDSPWFTTAP